MQVKAVAQVHHHLTQDPHLQIEAERRNVAGIRKERNRLLQVNHHAKQVTKRKEELKSEKLQIQVQTFTPNPRSLVQREKVTRSEKEIVIKKDGQGLDLGQTQVTVQEEEALQETKKEGIDHPPLSFREVIIDHTGGIE